MVQRIFYIIFLCSFFYYGQAQKYYIKGEVKSEKGKLLQNVAIIQKSTGYVYYSGMLGSFGITSIVKNDTFYFSLKGYLKQAVAVDPENYIEVILKEDAAAARSPYKLSSQTQNLRREVQQQWFVGDETYASIIENGFVRTQTYPSTGLSLNVDKASYSNIRRFLKMKTMVPPDAVRIEEMLNYFNFNYEPPPGNKIFEVSPVFTDCPWNTESKLLFINIRSRKLLFDSLPPTHLVFLIDISGSMDMPNRLPLLKTAFRGLVNNLREKDSVSIVVYGGTVGVKLNPTSGINKSKIFSAIDSLEPGGATPGESGVKLAYSVARNHFIKGGNNRVILATDGDFNVGLRSEDDLKEMVEAESKKGIYLTCLGVGMGNYKDSKIQALAEKGNGNFAYIDGYAEAEKVLLKEFAQTLYTVADDAVFKIDFNPLLIKEYRLVGFDNKVGAIKDTASVIEGGEIGSAYSTNILFEILPINDKKEVDGNTALVIAQFRLQYKLPNENALHEEKTAPLISYIPWLKLSSNYKLATSVAMFGMLLRGSRYCKDIGWNDVLYIANSAVDVNNITENEFIELVQMAKNIYGKKRKKN